MSRIKLLIADHDHRFTEYAVNSLKLYPEIEIASVADNGSDALHQIKHSNIDALIFEILLPGLDGISLLKRVNELKNPPATICCTRFYSDIAMEAARVYGASYVLYKPVEGHALYTSILSSVNMKHRIKLESQLIRALSVDNEHLRTYIHNYIITLGIPSKLIGCSYLTDAVLLATQDHMLMRNLSKGLYLEISRMTHTTPSCVERSIRNAISTAYSSHKLQGNFLQCPSNKEFIRHILQNLVL